MATNTLTGVTSGALPAAPDASQSVMGTQQMPALSTTSQPGIIAGAMNPTTTSASGTPIDYTGQVKQLYQNDLGREGEQAGIDYWNQKLQGGETLAQVQQDFLGSDEYKALHPTGGSAPATPAAPAQATSYKPTLLGDPSTWNVTGDQTVQGQMQKLIDPNSPYYQQWATAGAQDAAARGFTGNSSIRDTGILDSVMRGATPIATSDANTFAKAAGYNTDQENQFAMANQAASNTAGQVNANIGAGLSNAQTSANTSKYGADTTSTTQKYLSDQSAATQLAVSKMSNQSQQTISQLHDANSVLLQNNQSAQAAYNSYVSAVANIDIQPSMDAAAKAAAIATQTQIFNSTIAGLKNATPGTPDVSSPLDVSNAVQQVGGVDVSGQLTF